MEDGSGDEEARLTAERHDPNYASIPPESSDAEDAEERPHSVQEIRSFLGNAAREMVNIFIPVILCLTFTIFVVMTVPYYKRNDVQLVYTPYVDDHVDTEIRIWQSLVNALIVLAVVVAMTILLVVLYKFSCYKIILGWLILVSFCILFMFSGQFFIVLCYTVGVFGDYISFCIVLWNFGILGLLSIYWKFPLIVQQLYLIVIASQMAILFVKLLPDWTAWILLVLLAIWDLIAVLCPKGPLRILVETSHERGDNFLRSLVYSTASVWVLITEPESPRPSEASERQKDNPDDKRERTAADVMKEASQRQETGMKLGLGDFVFYSLLVGKAAVDGDLVVILATVMAVLVGVQCTLMVLFIRGHALPALPISICLALVFFFASKFVVSGFEDRLSDRQVFI